MMGMLKLMISKKKPKDLSKDGKELLATYGGKVDYVNKDTIISILNYLREE